MDERDRTAGGDQPDVDTSPTPHERDVVREREEGRTGDGYSDDPTVDPGRRPTAEEDLAADMTAEEDEDEDR